ncbi:MAG: apolipoprotein N-acyltransferase [Pseudomonadota bacterium]
MNPAAAWSPGRRRDGRPRGRRLHFLLAAVLGALTVLGFAPFYQPWIALLCLAALFSLWAAVSTPRQAAAVGFAFGLGLFGAGVSWVYISLHAFGGMPVALAVIATAGFCALLGLFPALLGFLQAAVPVGPALRFTLLVPGLWVVLEWVRSWLFTGFPWLALGYSQVPDSPLAALLPVLGVYGASLAAATLSGCAATVMLALAGPLRIGLPGTAGAVIVAAAVLGGALWSAQLSFTTPSGPPVAVSLLQGNVPQEMKWRPERARETLERYLGLARRARGKLVILPETALPVYLGSIPDEYWDALTEGVRARGGDVLVGVPERGPGASEYFNSAVSRGASPPQIYRKVHLVPFGEFIPPGFGWVNSILKIPLSDFSRGAAFQQPLAIAGERVAVNICYEDAFGEEIIRQLPDATLLANVTNVAWFGDSLALSQHLQISQARALETGRTMLRTTNTGVTALIGPDGRVRASLPKHTTGVLEARAQGYQGETPYVRWGNAAVLGLAVALIAFPLLVRPRSPTGGARQYP